MRPAGACDNELMYIPPRFHLYELDAWRVVHDAGAGVLVLSTSAGLSSVFVPVVVSDDRGIITSHVARANPWWKSVEPGVEVLAVFLTASAYVTPSWYPSRHEKPEVVPTWNYVAAEVRGTITVHDEPEWKLAQVRTQTERFEHGRDPQWRLEDAPHGYIAHMLDAIVGLEIEVASIEGKAKLSQNRPVEDRDSVRENLAIGSLAERNAAQRMKSRD